jgi:hypothetical protein
MWGIVPGKGMVFQVEAIAVLGFGTARFVVIDVAVGTGILFF